MRVTRAWMRRREIETELAELRGRGEWSPYVWHRNASTNTKPKYASLAEANRQANGDVTAWLERRANKETT